MPNRRADELHHLKAFFITVSKLIYQIGAELKRNPESSADYQGLVVELQALDRALKQPNRYNLQEIT